MGVFQLKLDLCLHEPQHTSFCFSIERLISQLGSRMTVSSHRKLRVKPAACLTTTQLKDWAANSGEHELACSLLNRWASQLCRSKFPQAHAHLQPPHLHCMLSSCQSVEAAQYNPWGQTTYNSPSTWYTRRRASTVVVALRMLLAWRMVVGPACAYLDVTGLSHASTLCGARDWIIFFFLYG